MDQTDQDIDTAGTEADDTYHERHGDQRPEPPDYTKAPLGVPVEDEGVERGTDPRTVHRGEDDATAFERSPEFHDQPAQGRESWHKVANGKVSRR